MKLKRALWIGALGYAVSFATGIVTALLLGVDLTEEAAAPVEVWYVGMFVTLIIGFVFAIWYFQDKKVKPSAKEGLYFGLIMIAVSFAIDFLLIVPYIIFSESPASIAAYYGNILFWISLILLIVSTTIAGLLKARKAA